MIEEISAFEFTYTFWDTSYPIRIVTVIIYARNRKEAELINLKYTWEFPTKDADISVKELDIPGYRQIKDK